MFNIYRKLFLAFRKVWIVKITPPWVPTTQLTLQPNFWSPPLHLLNAIWKTLKVEITRVQKIADTTLKMYLSKFALCVKFLEAIQNFICLYNLDRYNLQSWSNLPYQYFLCFCFRQLLPLWICKWINACKYMTSFIEF